MDSRVSSRYGIASEPGVQLVVELLIVRCSSVKDSIWQGGMLEYSEMQEAAPYWLYVLRLFCDNYRIE